MTYLAWIRKALVAATAAVAQLGIAVAPVSDGGATITLAEWIAIAAATLGTLGVYIVPNGPAPDGRHEA